VQVDLLGSGHVIDRTRIEEQARAGPFRIVANIFGEALTGSVKSAGPHHSLTKKVSLGDEHFLCLADKFDSLSGDASLGYLLLSSYEQPLRELRETQRTLFLVSVLGILFSTAVVWILIRKITQPLRQLRASAEAVGRGDFSSRRSHERPVCTISQGRFPRGRRGRPRFTGSPAQEEG